jgi:hypothetical protein
VRGLAFLATLELFARGGVALVVVGGLDQQPAGVSRAGLGDRSLTALLACGVLLGHDPEIGRQTVRMIEALELADLGTAPAYEPDHTSRNPPSPGHPASRHIRRTYPAHDRRAPRPARPFMASRRQR